jgi:AmmeMemoRadiSam system protein B
MQKITRNPIVAGQFYPASKNSAIHAVDDCISAEIDETSLPKTILAGIVPHAGWICSGAVAAKVFKAIHLRHPETQTFVLFGAAHRSGFRKPVMFPSGSWQSPLGEISVDETLGQSILSASSSTILNDPDAHDAEHSLEVQIPFIQRLFPNAKILPIIIPPTRISIETGIIVSHAVKNASYKIVCIGSTDLTHYGPSYHFTPHGFGSDGLLWAKNENDKGLIDLIIKMEAEKSLGYAEKTQSACGAGAIAATIAFAGNIGATESVLLEHTTSSEVLRNRYGDMDDSVGYAGIIFGCS